MTDERKGRNKRILSQKVKKGGFLRWERSKVSNAIEKSRKRMKRFIRLVN